MSAHYLNASPSFAPVEGLMSHEGVILSCQHRYTSGYLYAQHCHVISDVLNLHFTKFKRRLRVNTDHISSRSLQM